MDGEFFTFSENCETGFSVWCGFSEIALYSSGMVLHSNFSRTEGALGCWETSSEPLFSLRGVVVFSSKFAKSRSTWSRSKNFGSAWASPVPYLDSLEFAGAYFIYFSIDAFSSVFEFFTGVFSSSFYSIFFSSVFSSSFLDPIFSPGLGKLNNPVVALLNGKVILLSYFLNRSTPV